MPSPALRARHALAAAAVLATGLVLLTPLTWRDLGHWVVVAATVAGAVVLAAYLTPHVRRVLAWLTPAS
jgi:hypothetical protein